MHILITAGPTREHIDPIRFISNRSTGKMGFAIARAAAEAGHRVTLIAGPVTLPTPPGVARLDVVSALDMLAAAQARLPEAEAFIACAAVADWRPAQTAPAKLKKSQMAPTLQLLPNPDILTTLLPLKAHRLFIGFAAETGDPLPEATRKCRDKGLDLIVANDVTLPDAGFAVDTNRATLITPGAPPRVLPLMTKLQLGQTIIRWIEESSRA